MDYTLVHYRVEPWERRAFEYMRAKLARPGLARRRTSRSIPTS